MWVRLMSHLSLVSNYSFLFLSFFGWVLGLGFFWQLVVYRLTFVFLFAFWALLFETLNILVGLLVCFSFLAAFWVCL